MLMVGIGVVSCTGGIYYLSRRKKPVVMQEDIRPTAVWAVRVSLKETT